MEYRSQESIDRSRREPPDPKDVALMNGYTNTLETLHRVVSTLARSRIQLSKDGLLHSSDDAQIPIRPDRRKVRLSRRAGLKQDLPSDAEVYSETTRTPLSVITHGRPQTLFRRVDTRLLFSAECKENTQSGVFITISRSRDQAKRFKRAESGCHHRIAGTGYKTPLPSNTAHRLSRFTLIFSKPF
jgi:hypothetical protein